jgi:hypothetical protein
MTTFQWLARSVLVAIGLTVVQALAGSVLAPVRPPAGPSVLLWVLASNLLLALVLVHLAGRYFLFGLVAALLLR